MKTYKRLLKDSIMSDDSNIKVKMNAAAGVIIRLNEDGTKQILLIQRAPDDHWPHHWEFPRGKCDHGKSEDINICVKREIKEETGLDIKVIGIIDKFQYLADGGTRLTTCYNYLCEMDPPNQKIKLSKEHQDYKWISEIGQIELLVMPEQKRTIAKVLNKDRSIVAYDRKGLKSMLENYLLYIQEDRDKYGNRVSSPSKILSTYQNRVTAEYNKLMGKCPKLNITQRQKTLKRICMCKVIMSLNHTPPQCPDYENEKEKSKCISWMKSQYASYKSDVSQAKRDLINLEGKLKDLQYS
jgi:mutator protein MutT